jgi:hypothetical protein
MCLMLSCSSPRTTGEVDQQVLQGLGASAAGDKRQPRLRAAAQGEALAFLDGQAIGLDDLAPGLLEAAGGSALRDWLLAGLVERAWQASGQTLPPEALATEEAELIRSLADEAGVDAEQGERLLMAVRESRGLGPARFARELEQSAKLRRLVASDIAPPTDAELMQAYRARFGPRVTVRLAVSSTAAEAASLRERLLAAPSEDRRRVLAEAAFAGSIDPSASRGGVLSPLSIDDPAYPPAIRTEAQRLHIQRLSGEVGGVSKVIPVDRGFAVMMEEEPTRNSSASAPPAFEVVREALGREWIRRRQGQEMESWRRRALAQLIDRGMLAVQDPSLKWSTRALRRSP